MADLADVLDALQASSTTSCYPNGTSEPSVTGRLIAVGQGWPLAKDVDNAIAANETLVSVYAVPGTTAAVETPFDWNPGSVVAPVHGITVTLRDGGVLISGIPTAGEYVTILADGAVYTAATAMSDTVQSLAAALAAQIPNAAWSATADGAFIALPAVGQLDVRQGAQGIVGQITHRQRQNFQITVWASTPSDRTVVARAIDGALKASLSVTMPDTSEAIVRFQGSNLDDKREETSGYHRALIYTVEWDSLREYPAWEVTAPVIVNVVGSG